MLPFLWDWGSHLSQAGSKASEETFGGVTTIVSEAKSVLQAGKGH